MVDSGVLEKIQKVRALAEHGSAGEMENAAAMLSRLLLKHNLSLTTLDLAGDSLSGGVTHTFYEGGTTIMSWRAELMWQIAKHHFCQVISYGKPGDPGAAVWAIVGRPDNQKVVIEMYEWLEEEISRLGALELTNARGKAKNIITISTFSDYIEFTDFESDNLAERKPHEWTESWRLGAVRGVADRFDEERRNARKENEEEWGIIPLLEEETDNYVKDNFTVEEVKKKRSANPAVYSAGRKVGRGLGVRQVDE